MSNLRRVVAACFGMLLAYFLAVPDALAHDPAGTDVLLIAPLLDHVLHLIPWWVLLTTPPLLLGLGLACYVWLRGKVDLVDEQE